MNFGEMFQVFCKGLWAWVFSQTLDSDPEMHKSSSCNQGYCNMDICTRYRPSAM